MFIALVAYGVVAAVLRDRAPLAAAAGITAFAFWCLAEALGISITIWAVNDTWRAGYAAADPETQGLIRASLHTYSGIWNGVFFVILTTFLIGTLCYGIALASGGATERLLALLFLLAAPLCTGSWLLAGEGLRRLTGGAAGRLFGLAMALLLAVSALFILFG